MGIRVREVRVYRQHGHVLDVGVVLHGVAHHVVRVVVALPPAHGEAHEGREH